MYEGNDQNSNKEVIICFFLRSEMDNIIYIGRFESWKTTLLQVLKSSKFIKRLLKQDKILIKPNLVNLSGPPVTTPVGLVEVLVDFIQEMAPRTRIIIGEGTGAPNYDTQHIFEAHGYTSLLRGRNLELIDLNKAPLVRLSRPEFSRWPEMFLPRIALEAFLISVPVLKVHSLAGVTLSMKNMIGITPPTHYKVNGQHWKKAAFHDHIQEAILDLNRYRCPDFTIMDATVGMQESHLSGATCSPRPNLIVAGFDPVAVDAFGAGLLKKDWRNIGHIRMAHGELGCAEPVKIVHSC